MEVEGREEGMERVRRATEAAVGDGTDEERAKKEDEMEEIDNRTRRAATAQKRA